jgi:Bacterial PH domain
MSFTVQDEFEIEPVPGLPAELPKGERLLWQGKPNWRGIALRVFHVRGVMIWFMLLSLWRAVTTVYDGMPIAAAIPPIMIYLALGLIVVGFFVLFSIWIERTTIYSITSRRLIMRFGVALPMTVNLPFSAIEKAALRPDARGGGDIAISTREGQRAQWAILWPHVRPWRFRSPEPMLRALPDAEKVSRIFANAYLAAVDGATANPVQSGKPAPQLVPGLAPAAG